MVVIVVSGKEEGKRVQIPEGRFQLRELIGLPVDVEVFVSDGRTFIRGDFALPDGCLPDGWFEIEGKALTVASDFLLLWKTEFREKL